MTTMDDRTLIERAAKAAGYRIDEKSSDATWRDIRRLAILNDRGGHTLWNADEDDGDALRLAVKLKMGVDPWGAGACAVVFPPGDLPQVRESHCDDPCAATRRAIVRAAASLAMGE